MAASYNQPIFTKATNLSFPHSRLITGFVTRSTRRVPLVERELYTLPEHQSSPPVLSGVRVTRSLVLCVCFVDRCLSFCTFSFGHCVVCSSSIYGFWLPLWNLQTLLKYITSRRWVRTNTDCISYWGGGNFFFSVQKFFFGQHESWNIYFSPQYLTLGYMTKTLNQIIFFSSTKIRIFFQQHWESEYFFVK